MLVKIKIPIACVLVSKGLLLGKFRNLGKQLSWLVSPSSFIFDCWLVHEKRTGHFIQSARMCYVLADAIFPMSLVAPMKCSYSVTGKKSVNCLIWTTLISSFVNFVKWPCRLSIVIYTDRELTKNEFLFQKLLFVSFGRLGFKTDLHNLHNLTVNLFGLFFFTYLQIRNLVGIQSKNGLKTLTKILYSS